MDNKLISLTGLVAVVSVVMIAWPTPSVAQGYRSTSRDHRACTTGHNTCVSKGSPQGGVLVDGRATRVQVAPERSRGGTVNDHRRK